MSRSTDMEMYEMGKRHGQADMMGKVMITLLMKMDEADSPKMYGNVMDAMDKIDPREDV